MRMFGLGPVELVICCLPLFVVLGVAAFLALSRQSRSQASSVAGPTSVLPPAGAQPSPAAGWYGDPSGNHEVRYWDGGKWTEHVADNGVQKVDPL